MPIPKQVQINLDKTALENFNEIIKISSWREGLAPSKFIAGTPRVISDEFVYKQNTPFEEFQPMWNTEVTLLGVPAQGTMGQLNVRYWRLPIGKTRDQATTEFTFSRDVDIETVRNEICLAHALIPSEVIITGGLWSETESMVSQFTIEAKPESLLYVGQTTVTVYYEFVYPTDPGEGELLPE